MPHREPLQKLSDAADVTLYRSHAIVDGQEYPRLYKALVDHFAALYPPVVKATMTEFALGSGQTMRINRGQSGLTFDVTYFDFSRFAAIARALNVRLRRYMQIAALHWETERLVPVRRLLQLPRDIAEAEDPAEVLADIFHLNHTDPSERERRLAEIIDALYPGARLPSDETNNEWQRNIALLSDWLSLQHIKHVLIIEEPDEAAVMLVSMMFGGLATRVNAGNALPERDYLFAYLRNCIAVFVRGSRVPGSPQ